MKAIRVHQFGGPEVMGLEEIETPRPGAGQILLRLQAIGVNPIDTYVRGGSNPKLALPYTPGLDGAGVVRETGSGVDRVAVGARAYIGGALSGAYAEYALCSADQVYRLPDNLSFEQGAAVGVPYATAYRALFTRAVAQPGETVLVHGGSGGVGIAAIQLARAAGLNVIATAGSDEGRILVREQGAHHVLDHKAIGYLQQAVAITNGRGVDVILEMLANVNLGSDLPILAPRGRVIVIGSRGKVEITPRDAMTRDADVRAMQLFNATPGELAGIHAALRAGLENGVLRPVVGREMPLSAAAAAHIAVMEPGARGKIILKP